MYGQNITDKLLQSMKRWWNRKTITAVLAFCVAVITTASLVHPAITLNESPDEAGEHVQSEYVPDGYVLLHPNNPKDVGPDVIPVHYYIWADDGWKIIGSTKTGWYGDYNVADGWPPAAETTRDYITFDQMLYILEPYGLTATDVDSLSSKIWYERNETYTSGMAATLRHDTTTAQMSITNSGGETLNNEWIFFLSGNKLKSHGYNIYFTPEGTINAEDATNATTTYPGPEALAAALKPESKFYSLKVWDPNVVVYNGATEDTMPNMLPPYQYIQYNHPISVTVKAYPDEGGNAQGWLWLNKSGDVVNGILRKADTDHDGDYEDEDVNENFGYSYNPEDQTETYTYGSEQSGIGIQGPTQLIPFSNALGGVEHTTEKQVDIVVHLDGSWQKVGQLNLMYRKNGVCMRDDEPLWFVTAGQLYETLKDFGFVDPLGENDITKDGYTFCHANSAFDEDTDPSEVILQADGYIEKLNNAIAIGFGTEDIDNYTLFYIPGSAAENQADIDGGNTPKTAQAYAEDESLIAGDRFFSVHIVDNGQFVYVDYETENFIVYALENTVTTNNPLPISVQNPPAVLWTIREPWFEQEGYMPCDYTVIYEGEWNTYTFTEISGPVQIVVNAENPTYVVQYYADFERYALSDTAVGTSLPLIDTSGKHLPTNTIIQPLKYLQVSPIGANTDQNAGVHTPFYRVATYKDRAAIYKQQEFSYNAANLWHNIDKLYQNDGYMIDSVWILKDGKNPDSQLEDDWWIYRTTNNGENISFTNRPSAENAPHIDGYPGMPADRGYTILITEGMVIRLQYVLKTDYVDMDASFFDYDISIINDNKADVRQRGINGIHQGQINTANRYAFGNDNCYTGMNSAMWNGNYLNKYNSAVYKGCTFGLVENIAANGAITWGNNIIAPKLFNDTQTGRTDYNGSLRFIREGDVYTLTATSVPSAGSSARDNLEYFFNPSPNSNTIYGTIFTNNFWVLDKATNKTDGLWGGGSGTSRGVVNGYENDITDNTRGGTVTDKTLPPSDDGVAHNWFFGMSYSIGFNVTDDYVGPLEYLFFGDDDMWVFLDSDTDDDGIMDKTEQICDIGGVHSAVGEYVDLRDYLPIDGPYTSGNHVLRFYYTERGASGSTCWMSFTLPTVTSMLTEYNSAPIEITKSVQDKNGAELHSDNEYEFQVKFYTNSDKNEQVNMPFTVRLEKADGTSSAFSISYAKSILLCAGDKATILGVPIGTYYVIEEKNSALYNVFHNEQDGNIAEGTVSIGINSVAFVNVPRGYVLPNTGGIGTTSYILSGWAVIAVGIALMIYKTKRKKRSPVN